MAKKDLRFVQEYKESAGMIGKRVIVDKQTGVNYLFVSEGYAGGITVLVDEDGKPLVSRVSTLDSE